MDLCTQSNYKDIKTDHVHLDWSVDWDKRIISGKATYTLRALRDGVTAAILDTSFLDISGVTSPDSQKLNFTLGDKTAAMGHALTVFSPSPLATDATFTFTVAYATTTECTAIGWLEASQTSSGLYPFLYSQNQAIHARSLLPVQDTPAIKFTYSASVSSRLPILMSALRTAPAPDAQVVIDGSVKTYEFNQPLAVPSYLLAIAGGEVAFAALGDRTGVYAEPALLDAAVWEFKKDTERFVKTAEDLVTPYVWGRYDFLVLPASFPYGGMENCNLTFVTPSLLTGDRANVDTVAHEIAHSWFGNLIGCANWDSFWLNEGFTTYTERLIQYTLHGAAERDFEFILGEKALADTLKQFRDTPVFQRLHTHYEKGQDPDDGFSTIPYEKGATLLYLLERTVGGVEAFLPYVRAYARTFAGKSLTTYEWLDHFWTYWNAYPETAAKLRDVDFEAWLHGEGTVLPTTLKYDTSLADAVYSLAARWDASRNTAAPSFKADDIAAFTSPQLALLLDQLETYDAFPKSHIELFDEVYAMKAYTNCEILSRYFVFTLKAGLFAERAIAFVKTTGRMKFARPVYRAVFAVDPELARKTFLEHGVHFLHPIARNMVKKDLGL